MVMLHRGDVVASRWTIVRQIGAGTFSEIYEARLADDVAPGGAGGGGRGGGGSSRRTAKSRNALAAVKIMTGGDEGTLKREAKCLQLLRDSGCSPVLYAQDPRQKVLVMERMGESLSTLRRRLPRGTTFCVRDAAAISLQLLQCIDKVHQVRAPFGSRSIFFVPQVYVCALRMEARFDSPRPCFVDGVGYRLHTLRACV